MKDRKRLSWASFALFLCGLAVPLILLTVAFLVPVEPGHFEKVTLLLLTLSLFLEFVAVIIAAVTSEEMPSKVAMVGAIVILIAEAGLVLFYL